jgi:hypothetical protein
VTVTDKTYDLLIDCANRLNVSGPDAVKHLAERFLAENPQGAGQDDTTKTL